MGERLYTLRHDQGYFEVGLAHGKQVLLGNTVHEIVAHWFDTEGRFLGLERLPMAVDPPTFPGTTIYRARSEYHRAVDAAMVALKEQLGFRPADIQVRAFESEEASIANLPGEYEEFLESPESADPEEREHFPQYIAEWQVKGRPVRAVLACGLLAVRGWAGTHSRVRWSRRPRNFSWGRRGESPVKSVKPGTRNGLEETVVGGR